jgi:hypothetical protein
MRRAGWLLGLIALASFDAGAAVAQSLLYSQNFDTNSAANWKVNNNGAGTNGADFFFNYGALGIPSAPNSVGGTTRGLKLTANTSSVTAPASGPKPGISVSPLGQSFSGNFEVRFDWWSNYVGPLGASPATSTQVSTFGVMTSGNVANYVGSSDGVFFAASGNGGVPNTPATINEGDFSAYSVERPNGYQVPIQDPKDAHVLHLAGSRDNSAALYGSVFPSGATAPAIQQTNFAATQTGSTPSGATGFRWHQVEIEKIGNNVVWRVNGAVLIFMDTAAFQASTGGGNILFGHSDINLTTSTNANFPTLQFTLIDNVRVLSLAGDYNRDGNVDAADYAVWKQQYGATGANPADGNGDGKVDAADYTVWRNTLSPIGPGGSGGLSTVAVPEPTFTVLFSTLIGLAAISSRWRSR